jgi:hypothetical protein
MAAHRAHDLREGGARDHLRQDRERTGKLRRQPECARGRRPGQAADQKQRNLLCRHRKRLAEIRGERIAHDVRVIHQHFAHVAAP